MEEWQTKRRPFSRSCPSLKESTSRRQNRRLDGEKQRLALEGKYDAACRDLNKGLEKAEEDMKKGDEQIISLQQSLHAQSPVG